MDKKEIRKNFDGLTDDVLDNYEKYEIIKIVKQNFGKNFL